MPSALHSLPPVLLPLQTSSPSHGSLYFLRRCRIFELGGEAPRAPPGSRNMPKVPTLWAPGAGGPLRIGAPTQGAKNCAAPGTSMALTLWGPSPGGALNAPSPLAAVMLAPRSAGSIDQALREAEAALGPLPPVADAPVP
jgi:hypothetical protein